MTYRERKEARIARRLDWAASREAKFGAAMARSRNATAGIPFGQPILVGHHSEGMHRAALARSDSAMRQACESSDMAQHHTEVADGIQRQLDTSIYSDDHNAVEALRARIAEREAKRDNMKLTNKLYKKGDAEGLAAIGLDIERVKAGVARQSENGRLSWLTMPHPAYEITNIGATIRTDKKRLVDIEAQQGRLANAEAAGGMTVESFGEYVRVTFAEKPDRETLDALRGAGYTWGAGSWVGKAERLPDTLRTNEITDALASRPIVHVWGGVAAAAVPGTVTIIDHDNDGD